MPENINSYGYGIKYLIDHNITKESAIQFYEEYNKMLRNRDWRVYQGRSSGIQVSKDGEVPRGLYFKDAFLGPAMNAGPPEKFDRRTLKIPDSVEPVDIDDKNPDHIEEQIHRRGWQHNPRIAQNPKAETEGAHSKKENTDPNRERRVELGKTTAIETFKFMGDLPVTLLNKQADNLAKEYKSLQKEIPAYVVKQGRLTKVGVLSPLGLIYDTYQDAQKYNGEKFVVATVINGASFAFTLVVDNALVGTGVGALAVPIANSSIAILTNSTKEFFLGDTNKKQGRN